jgi:hypothetical protein
MTLAEQRRLALTRKSDGWLSLIWRDFAEQVARITWIEGRDPQAPMSYELFSDAFHQGREISLQYNDGSVLTVRFAQRSERDSVYVGGTFTTKKIKEHLQKMSEERSKRDGVYVGVLMTKEIEEHLTKMIEALVEELKHPEDLDIEILKNEKLPLIARFMRYVGMDSYRIFLKPNTGFVLTNAGEIQPLPPSAIGPAAGQ